MSKGDHLTSHKVNGCNSDIEIRVQDDPGHGGASHEYAIYMPNDCVNEELNAAWTQTVSFQNGPIREHGVNGITQEALLAIVEHRLQSFQSGDYACRENAIALTKIQEAMLWLQKRTSDRVKRGVEGTREA